MSISTTIGTTISTAARIVRVAVVVCGITVSTHGASIVIEVSIIRRMIVELAISFTIVWMIALVWELALLTAPADESLILKGTTLQGAVTTTSLHSACSTTIKSMSTDSARLCW